MLLARYLANNSFADKGEIKLGSGHQKSMVADPLILNEKTHNIHHLNLKIAR